MNGLTKRQRSLLEEAARRYKQFHSDEVILTAWTGLGTYAQYKPVVDAGFMIPKQNEHTPRCNEWYVLTEKGAAIVKMFLAIGLTGE